MSAFCLFSDIKSTETSWKLRAFSLLQIAVLFLVVASSAYAQNGGEDALEQYRLGNYTRAAEITMSEIQANPNRIDAYVVLGWSLLALNQHKEAAGWAEQALRISRYDYRVLHILAEANNMLENDSDTIKYAQEYLAVNPEGRLQAQMYSYLGEAFYRIGEFNHADIALTTAVQLAPNRAEWWLLLGQAREAAENLVLAEEAYRRALALRPNLTEATAAVQRLSDNS